MPRITGYKVTVRGHHAFPLDMLRYDQAYPASEGESYTIGRALMERNLDEHEVTLNMPRHPTIARWDSFGWEVIDVQPIY